MQLVQRLQSEHQLLVSDQIVRRRPHEANLYARRPLRTPALSGGNRGRRLEWVHEVLPCEANQWSVVLITDESRFSFHSNIRRGRVWRVLGRETRQQHPQEVYSYLRGTTTRIQLLPAVLPKIMCELPPKPTGSKDTGNVVDIKTVSRTNLSGVTYSYADPQHDEQSNQKDGDDLYNTMLSYFKEQVDFHKMQIDLHKSGGTPSKTRNPKSRSNVADIAQVSPTCPSDVSSSLVDPKPDFAASNEKEKAVNFTKYYRKQDGDLYQSIAVYFNDQINYHKSQVKLHKAAAKNVEKVQKVMKSKTNL
ncbi:unnamed protein product [Chrysodeixis includens]|uniref:Transposase Tc1-like domain-containing protein n=1 Tax=Chrysodeixis includens TaxID=689277 RepID=A0A9P0E4I6_CHRIL|nr:unnamed protein product [Chrysodeixis includens]